jgi:hypothetical protein
LGETDSEVRPRESTLAAIVERRGQALTALHRISEEETMKTLTILVLTILIQTITAWLSPLQLTAQDMASCPMHKDAKSRQADVEKRGDEAMGFAHDKTTHHFRLFADGGAIEVTVDDSKDSQDLQAIRLHLNHIAGMFSEGDFSAPMFIHSQVPPGVSEMKERRADISYKYEELPAGAKVRIVTKNRDALNAIHDFLIFQIEEHHTGDSTDVAVPSPSR